MSDGRTSARATLDAWREQGAERLDPVRFHVMEALERRASGRDGDVRQWLDRRLDSLLDDYAGLVERAAVQQPPVVDKPIDSSLRGLVEAMAVRENRRFPELPLLGEFRQLWSGLRTESQLRQSLQPAPANAGPLNSSALAHRAIALMRELSPGYLRHFLAYVDALSWMEQMPVDSAVGKDAARNAPVRKRSREKKEKPA